MAEIPRFSLDETEELGSMLESAGIPYERRGVVASVRRYGGRLEFLLDIPDDRLADAVEVIKSYYGFLDTPPEAVNGTCPACNASVNNAFECPDCGLSLSFDSRGLMRNHPFTVFLDKLEQTGKQTR